MKLREPRTKIPPSSYGHDMLKLMHPMMFAPILMLVVIGTFLAPQLDLISFILELIGVICAVICAYHLDEGKEKVTAPSVPQLHNAIIAIASFIIAISIGVWLFLTVSLILIMPTTIAFLGIFLYNGDIIKSRLLYALSWGGTPIFGSYMLQTGTWPDLTVIIFTIFGMLWAIKLFWMWSMRTCGRASICPKRWNLHICHSPRTIYCKDRQEMPKEINSTVKILQKLDLLILFALMIGVILF